VEPLVDALAFAHGLRIAHRDVKPSNVLMDEATPQFSDFGLAKDIDDSNPQTVGIWASGIYTPSERGTPFQHDVFSLGVLISSSLLNQTFESVGALRDSINQQRAFSADFKDILLRCVEDDPEARFRNGMELAEAMRKHKTKKKVDKERESFLDVVRLSDDLRRRLALHLSAGQNPEQFLEDVLNAKSLAVRAHMNNDTQQPERYKVWVLCGDFEVKLSSGPEDKEWRALEMRALPLERLDAMRSRALQLGDSGVRWSVNPESKVNAQHLADGHNRTVSKYHDWLDNGRDVASTTAKPDLKNPVLSSWLEVLEARSALQIEGIGTLDYIQAELDGKRLHLELSRDSQEMVDVDLMGQFWQIEADRRFAGEVVAHVDAGVTLLLKRDLQKNKLPGSGSISRT
ncbi:hypothetical protein EBZ37_13585, partial [bacterium]|nr:hypothetical protein [bacterium]